MKLVEALNVIRTENGYVTICQGAKEMEHQMYFIKWHYKDLLEKEVTTICEAEGKMYIRIKGE